MDRREVLRYMGHSSDTVSAELSAIVERAVKQCELAARPRSIIARLDGTFIFAVTLGIELDRELERLTHVDMLLALAYDAAGSALVEEECDKVERKIGETVQSEGHFLGRRFSPGYGDIPLSLQPELLRTLDCQRQIGLYCTDSFMLIPQKSVTCIAVVSDEPDRGCGGKCSRCSLDGCAYRRG